MGRRLLKKVRGGVTAPGGYLAAGIACGIKPKRRKDLSLLLSETPASWAATLTKSRVPAAPVLLTRETLRRRRCLRAVVVNSGNANAATGSRGLEAAREIIAATAELLGVPEWGVVMASTGIIGEQLPLPAMKRALPGVVKKLARGGGRSAAEGIMTTDTIPKETAIEVDLGTGGRVRIGGMAKGAGMIHPDMATMLAFLTTDAALPAGRLRKLLREVVDGTFNRISVDGDRSTNDTVLILANGVSAVDIASGSREESLFRDGLHAVCRRLAEDIVSDGEGATKLVEVTVTGARSDAEALKAARAIANSSLVKTAWYGSDLNWGRILAALGYSGAVIDVGRTAISVNGAPAVRRGTAVTPRELARARRAMRQRKLQLAIDLGVGTGRDRILTCDLSEQYVRENSLYST